MREFETPILDDHLHLDPRHGRGVEAAKDFARSGGTHLLVVNKPSWLLGVTPETGEDFRAVYEETIETVEAASDVLRGRAWPVLGVHPALISRLVDDRGYDPDTAADLMKAGLETAAEYAASGPAVALKSGRPHYDVSDAVWDASNEVLRRALELAAETGVAVQLHTEQTTDLTDVAAWAEDAGLAPERVVKHYASGQLDGVTKSVMARKEYLETAIEVDEPFLMETDFVDDPDRPGAVMGPKTVPRRVDWLLESGHEPAVRTAHVETPETVYGIDTVATLDD
ncbi:TatD family hydrolase [Halanaeroarchaeum sulfurireducens]|uniref:TatD-related deoxyribonuclease n=1 Tax=Halanaeroarchaeum sulfurireducens TaxID=1604004 RepID=A0A0F7PBV5_9EURY|nr:TatD family hydrolase [Halanaeroarchaeum sulfurireducens]AKH98187.1 TatD-related deoxyribonuclease [Halanaeroarchaeum sulfurireducens]ALG82581.1 TatD-related deoxyribonuclease [Halanaeroarchaeum sulfurireducens]